MHCMPKLLFEAVREFEAMILFPRWAQACSRECMPLERFHASHVIKVT